MHVYASEKERQDQVRIGVCLYGLHIAASLSLSLADRLSLCRYFSLFLRAPRIYRGLRFYDAEMREEASSLMRCILLRCVYAWIEIFFQFYRVLELTGGAFYGGRIYTRKGREKEGLIESIVFLAR